MNKSAIERMSEKTLIRLAQHCERQSFTMHKRSLLLSDSYGALAIHLRRSAVARALASRKRR
jgi:hypothetical protein